MPKHLESGSIILRCVHVPALLFCLLAATVCGEANLAAQDSLSFREAVEKTLEIAGIESGMIIGEVGAGEGSFTRNLAERVGRNGRIYANDIDQESLNVLAGMNLPNVETVLGETDDPLFPAKNLDVAIMRSVFHDLENPLAMLENLKAYLKPGASLVVVGPRPPDENKTSPLPIHSMSKEEMLDIVDRSSFVLESATLIPSWWGVNVFKVAKNKEKEVWPNWLKGFNAAVQGALRFERAGEVSFVKKRIAWERVFDSYRDNNPRSTEDEELRDFVRQRIASLDEEAARSAARSGGDARSDVPQPFGSEPPGHVLRSDYCPVSLDDISRAFERLGFKVRAKLRAESGDFPNRYTPMSPGGDRVVVDRATGLVWHRGGSSQPLDYFAALEWIDDLNIRLYAGYSDWRLPTVEEAASLMETRALNGDLLIDPEFSQDQRVIWTGDPYYGGRNWLARFYRSSFADDLKVHLGWVRPVR